MTEIPAQRRCQAVTANRQTHQIGWVARCQNKAAATVDGIHLCGTHINAVHRGDVEVICTMLRKED